MSLSQRNKPVLKILMLEDSSLVADLVKRELADSGFHYELTWVSQKNDFMSDLIGNDPDVVFLDGAYKDFEAPAALIAIRWFRPELPVIIFNEDAEEPITLSDVGSDSNVCIMVGNLSVLGDCLLKALRKKQDPIINSDVKTDICC